MLQIALQQSLGQAANPNLRPRRTIKPTQKALESYMGHFNADRGAPASVTLAAGAVDSNEAEHVVHQQQQHIDHMEEEGEEQEEEEEEEQEEQEEEEEGNAIGGGAPQINYGAGGVGANNNYAGPGAALPPAPAAVDLPPQDIQVDAGAGGQMDNNDLLPNNQRCTICRMPFRYWPTFDCPA